MTLILGILLIGLVTGVAVALGWKAARGVETFREEHHTSFLGKDRRDG